MTTQSEAQLEVALVRQLVGQGFRLASIQDGDDLLLNLKEELEAFNGHRYSDREFKKVLNHLSKGSFFTKAENLRDRSSSTATTERRHTSNSSTATRPRPTVGR